MIITTTQWPTSSAIFYMTLERPKICTSIQFIVVVNLNSKVLTQGNSIVVSDD